MVNDSSPPRLNHESAARQELPSEEHLPSGLQVKRIHKGCDAGIARSGIELTKRCFPGDSRAAASRQSSYDAIMRGESVRKMEDSTSSDFGRHLEACGSFVYYRDDNPVAMGGIFRYLEEPDLFWLGRFAVVPRLQGQGIGRAVISHISDCVRSFGGKALYAYTAPGAENAATHRIYERLGFAVSSVRFIESGVEQRVYCLVL